MAPRNYARRDTWAVKLRFEGNMIDGFWDTRTGGEIDTDTTTYSPGGMLDPLALGSTPKPQNLVLGRIFTETDMAILDDLLRGAGSGACIVYQHPLDFNKKKWGKSIVWHGILKRVNMVEVDSNSTDAGIYEIEITPAGTPQVGTSTA